MGENKHTPGPWTARPANDGSGDIGICAPGVSNVIAECFADMRFDGERNFAEAKANARLIVSAPELLAELKSLRLAYVNLLEIGRDRILGLGGTCDPVDVMEAGDPALKSASAIIAKAEGR